MVHRWLPTGQTTIVLGTVYWLVGLYLLVEPEFITRCEGDTCWYYSVLTYDSWLFLAGVVATTLASAALAPASVVGGRAAGTAIGQFIRRLDRRRLLIGATPTGLLAAILLVLQPFEQCVYTQYGPSGCESLTLWEVHPGLYVGAVFLCGVVSLVGATLIAEACQRFRG